MDVKQVAKLANLPISSPEEKKFATQFSETLKTVDLINQVDTTSIKPTYQVTGLTNITRPDTVVTDRVLSQSDVLAQASGAYNGFIVVPRTILDE